MQLDGQKGQLSSERLNANGNSERYFHERTIQVYIIKGTIVVDVVRKQFSDITDREFEACVMSWFRHAESRRQRLTMSNL